MDAYGVVASGFWITLPPPRALSLSLAPSQTHTLCLTVSPVRSGVSLPSWVDAYDNDRRDECRWKIGTEVHAIEKRRETFSQTMRDTMSLEAPELAESVVGEYVGGDKADAPDLMTLRTSQISQ